MAKTGNTASSVGGSFVMGWLSAYMTMGYILVCVGINCALVFSGYSRYFGTAIFIEVFLISIALGILLRNSGEDNINFVRIGHVGIVLIVGLAFVDASNIELLKAEISQGLFFILSGTALISYGLITHFFKFQPYTDL